MQALLDTYEWRQEQKLIEGKRYLFRYWANWDSCFSTIFNLFYALATSFARSERFFTMKKVFFLLDAHFFSPIRIYEHIISSSYLRVNMMNFSGFSSCFIFVLHVSDIFCSLSPLSIIFSICFTAQILSLRFHHNARFFVLF